MKVIKKYPSGNVIVKLTKQEELEEQIKFFKDQIKYHKEEVKFFKEEIKDLIKERKGKK